MNRIIRKGYRIIGMKGGGGTQTTTSTSGVPDWLRPDVQGAFNKATEAANTPGGLDHVEGFDDAQKRGYDAQEVLSRQTLTGENEGLNRTLQNLEGQQLAGTANSGGLGSARASAQRQSVIANQAAGAQQQALQGLQGAGAARQQQRQTEADATHQGLQRQFGYFGSGAAGTSSTNTAPKSGGGK